MYERYRYVLSILYFCCGLLTTLWLAPASVWGENRSIDGTLNNLEHPAWGAAIIPFARQAPAAYGDGVASLAGASRPGPREISNRLFRQEELLPNSRRLSGYIYAFGQFISHDMQETISGVAESIDIRIPRDDDIFQPGSRFPLTRSIFDPASGQGPENPRQQVNFTTSFIDGSQVYGSDENVASILRGGPGKPVARLRTSNDINGDGQNLLPRDAFGPLPQANFAAGDSRVNDNVVLTGLHTLFMREHNRLVGQLAVERPDWSDEELYQRARKIVGAELQAITFHEFLPALLGPHSPSPHGNYDPNLEPTVVNEFPTVFLRIGHSMLTPDFKRVENDGTPAPEGPLPLVLAFFDPTNLQTSEELDLFLKGLSTEIQEETDLGLVDAMRIAALGAIDIQRARDHGLADYNTMREAYGLDRVTSFAEITSNAETQTALAELYDDFDSIDAFVGALAEDHLPGASVGPLVAAGYTEQFTRLRDGDRFWYENDSDFTPDEVAMLGQTRLSDIIVRNTGIDRLQSNVFVVPEPSAVALGAILFGLFATRHSRNRNRRVACRTTIAARSHA